MFEKMCENWWKWRSVEVWEAPFGTWGPRCRPRSPRGAPRGAKTANMAPRWANMAPRWGPKSAPKSWKFDWKHVFLIAFLLEFWRDLGAKIDETSSPKSKKTWLQTRWAKTMKMCTALMRKSHFLCFGTSQIHQKSKKKRYRKHDFLGAGFEVDFSWIWGGFWKPNGTPNRWKNHKKKHLIFK